ncbi:uncharacterized protein METZ01_LOCUS493199 [marine metagenome]|uniref:DoxX family protein n=1 Tax=marine metagenome TaxID=408172 RepID=A0A383D7W7_9ZZZZ
MDFMKQYEGQSYALLRIVSGFLFIFHGADKFLKLTGMAPYENLGVDAPVWMSQTGLACSIEIVCGAMIMIGLYSSIAAFLSSGLMAGAYWLIHFSKMGGGWPANNKGELAVMFCFAFLYIAAKGSGMWSVDSKRH